MAKRGPDVTIRYPDGREYQITPADYNKARVVLNDDGKEITHEQAGAKILHWNNGEPYEEGEKAPPLQKKRERNQRERSRRATAKRAKAPDASVLAASGEGGLRAPFSETRVTIPAGDAAAKEVSDG